MKIVVTGGLGYIGSFLLRRLPQKFPQAEIAVLDNLSTGNLSALPSGKIQFIKGDICTFNFERLRLSPYDIVVHLAGLSRPLESFENQENFFSVNCGGAVRTAEACAKTGAFFFFPSTTSVYHETSDRLISGTRSNLRPQTPYAASKLAAEVEIEKIPDLSYTIVRFGTIYGTAPVFSLQTAVNKFCWQAAAGRPISVWATALDQYRPYLDLKDAVRLIEFLIKENEFFGQTYNAVTGHATPKQVIQEIKRFHCDLEIKKIPARAMNKLSYKVSREPLEHLGFKFQGDLRKAVKEILSSYRASKISAQKS